MTQEERAKQKDIFLQFQKDWTLDRVKNMTLEEYTGIKSDGERKDFTYILEYGDLKEWGSIKGVAGGLSNLKFWICRCSGNEKGFNREVLYSNDRKYVWLKEYYDKDNNPNEAFKEIKSRIIEIIQASQRNDLDGIEKIRLEGMVKWKIAFHYQNPNDMKMFCIFKPEVLRRIAKNELGNENLPISQIYMGLMKDKTYTLEDSVNEFSKPLWKKYNQTTSNDKEESTTMDKAKIPLNQILYGPPGTGKTYSTIDKALEILKSFDCIDEIPQSREEKRETFNAYKEKGQIEFITFHQSFSYEEFVEGIKPETSENGDNVLYPIKNGIFKKICKSALKNLQDSQKDKATLSEENQTARLFEAFVEHIQNQQENNVEYILDGEKNWLVSILDWANYKVIKIFSHTGFLCNAPVFLNRDKIKAHYKDFVTDNSFKIPSKENRTGYIDTHRFYTAFFKKMQEFEAIWKKQNSQDEVSIDNALKPYILIIDEINRGNISKILGELITLIEESKRIGGAEELKVRLPYSTEEFGVPSNLYIIGTMNTADRSIALLDTALRRRFEFVEMMPKPELLKNIWLVRDINKAEETSLDKWEDDDAEILFNILTAINNRIEFLLDREHTIGHSFFFEKAKFVESGGWYELSLADLKDIFAKKIIPLLQEYFYEDYAKIDAVLNGNGMVKSHSMKDLGVKFSNEFVDEDKKIYRISSSSEWSEDIFKTIYLKDSSKSNENGE